MLVSVVTLVITGTFVSFSKVKLSTFTLKANILSSISPVWLLPLDVYITSLSSYSLSTQILNLYLLVLLFVVLFGVIVSVLNIYESSSFGYLTKFDTLVGSSKTLPFWSSKYTFT